VVKRMVRSMPGHAVLCDYLAFYGTDHSDAKQRAAFLTKVRRTFGSWLAAYRKSGGIRSEREAGTMRVLNGLIRCVVCERIALVSRGAFEIKWRRR
jgi:hypothetical protein